MIPPRDLTLRLLKFGATGLFSTLLHFLIVWGLVELRGVWPPNANLVAFGVATCFAFLVNTYWSFSSQFNPRRLVRYGIVAGAGATFAWLISYAFVHLDIDYRLGVLAVTLMVPPVVFIAHQLWTYRP